MTSIPEPALALFRVRHCNTLTLKWLTVSKNFYGIVNREIGSQLVANIYSVFFCMAKISRNRRSMELAYCSQSKRFFCDSGLPRKRWPF